MKSTIPRSIPSVPVGVRLDTQTLAQLRALAEADHRSLSGMIGLALGEWLKGHPAQEREQAHA